MIVRKTLLTAAASALVSATAWALPTQAVSHPNGPPAAVPNNTNNPGASHRSEAADDALEAAALNGAKERGEASGEAGKHPQHAGKSHRCKSHTGAYVASGTLESWTLTKNADGTYSGTIKALVTRTNHHGASDRSVQKEYKLEHVHLVLAISDSDSDGAIETDDVKAGDRVQLIGKTTFLTKKCPSSGSAATTIRQVVLHDPDVS